MSPAFRPCFLLLGLVALYGTTTAWGKNVQLSSPSDTLRFEASNDGGQLQYSLHLNDTAVIEPSAIAVQVDGTPIADQVQLGTPERYEINETYPWHGVHALATNRCRGMILPLLHRDSGTSYRLEVRVYDDGAAFRYLIPGEGARVPDEATCFTLPAHSTVWYHDLGGHYEATYQKQVLEEVAKGQWAAPPVTFQLPGDAGYATITEAALTGYSGMALQFHGDRRFRLALGHHHPISYPFELRYEADIETVSQPAVVDGPILSPWRVVLVSKDLNTLVNSDVIHNLCPPPDPKLFPDGIQTDWVRPGRAVWRYLDGGERSLDGIKEFSRLAGQLGFEYQVVEGFWTRWTDQEIQDLVEFSRRQGVGLFFWRHSRELRTPEERAAFFGKLQRLGVAGAKIDFFDHEHKDVVNLYPALLEDAAKFQILVCFHGSNKPTGEPRTWPNELTRESVRGMESSRLRERASHDATIPFTRLLAGHADYTPVHFGERRADTTWAHQIATAAVFTSPLLTYAAHPESLLQNPGVDLIKAIPAVWDQTVVLPASEIGEVAVFARRTGDVWFLAIVNGPQARRLQIGLSFLGDAQHQALIISDLPEQTNALHVDQATFSGLDVLDVQLAAGGGFVARFVKP